jgi:hypothetical protein
MGVPYCATLRHPQNRCNSQVSAYSSHPPIYDFWVIFIATARVTLCSMLLPKFIPLTRKPITMVDEKRRTIFPLRLAISLRDMACSLAHKDGVSLNHFISLAVAEKISRLESETLNEHNVLGRRHKLAAAAEVINKSLYS